ncbi:MAG: hypothetical protein ABIF01_03225 [Candidatus Micrarchaeota archaeon]
MKHIRASEVDAGSVRAIISARKTGSMYPFERAIAGSVSRITSGEEVFHHLRARSSSEKIYSGNIPGLVRDSLGEKAQKGINAVFGLGNSDDLNPSIVLSAEANSKSNIYHLTFDSLEGERQGKKYASNTRSVLIERNPISSSFSSGQGRIIYSFDLIATEKRDAGHRRGQMPLLMLIQSEVDMVKLALEFSNRENMPGMGVAFGQWKDGIIRYELGEQILFDKLKGEGAIVFRTEQGDSGKMRLHAHSMFIAHRKGMSFGKKWVGGHTAQAIPNGNNYALFFPD